MLDNKLNLDGCVKCSDCNTACPVFKVCPSYPGPKFLGPELERIRKEGIPCETEWVDYCTGCERCDLVCPNQVKISSMISGAKAGRTKQGVRRFRDRLLGRPRLAAKAASIAPGLAQTVLRQTPSRFLMSQFFEISGERALPAYASRRLPIGQDEESKKERILYFPGCFVEFNAPEVGRAVLDVLHRNGYAVDISSFRCCGLPALANGDREEMLRNARHNILEMTKASERGKLIVSGCPSCSLTLKATYPELFSIGDPLRTLAHDVSRRTYDLGELLMKLAQEKKLRVPKETARRKFAYHAPCHLKAQGLGTPWVEILSAIPGFTVTDTAADCCGMAGTYGFKKEKYAISMDIGKELFNRIHNLKPDFALSECGMCQEQIRQGTGLDALHPVMILRDAYNGVTNVGSSRDE
jgi:glycerol-3-phosphate dehydrogenase subunit C